jgi:hypothetical protein
VRLAQHLVILAPLPQPPVGAPGSSAEPVREYAEMP